MRAQYHCVPARGHPAPWVALLNAGRGVSEAPRPSGFCAASLFTVLVMSGCAHYGTVRGNTVHVDYALVLSAEDQMRVGSMRGRSFHGVSCENVPSNISISMGTGVPLRCDCEGRTASVQIGPMPPGASLGGVVEICTFNGFRVVIVGIGD